MFSASISPAIFRDCTPPWVAGFHPDSSSATKSGIVVVAQFQVRQPVVKSAERSTRWSSCIAFAGTSQSCPVAVEGTFSADTILKTQSRSHAWMGLNKTPETPTPTPVIHAISLIRRCQDSRIFSGRGSASLRRLTKPLRVFIRRRLSRGACRPPSIPPASAAFERVHARAGVGSAP